jgi:hypothetical protein
MGALNTYLKQTQRFLRDQSQQFLNPGDLIDYVNRARREIAMRAECLRVLTPISGSVVSVTVTAPGSGYTAPTVTISAPDFPSGTLPKPNGDQATALAIVQSGTIAAIDVQYGGYGYFQPQVTITDPTGTGATATATVSYINEIVQGQEVYPFSAVNLAAFPGVASIYMIKSVSLIYSNYRYSLPCYSFSTYQAMIRQYPFQYQWVSTFCAQYGQGTNGSFYMYPLPSQTYQLEWDCFCLPSDLITDLSAEALPAPWTEAVPYFAAHLAYLELQNFNFAKGYLDLFDQFMHRYSAYARPGRVTNPYGRF